MPIIAISNQKGGCGKTTTAINLSASLSSLGKKTLLVDIDPQSHASLGLNMEINKIPTIYDVLSKFSKNKKNIQEVILKLNENLWLVPSNILLSTLEQELANEIGRESRINDIILPLREKFDYIVLDCPPNLGILTVNAIRAAGELIIPLEISRFSIEGVKHLLDVISIIRDKLNQSVNWRILITVFDSRLQYSHRLLNKIKEDFAGKLFDTIIHINVKLKEAAGEGKPVLEHDKYCRGSKDYLSLAKEILLLSTEKKETWIAKDMLRRKASDFIKTVFSLNVPSAKSVYLVGDFNNWSKENSVVMERANSGGWTKTVFLKPGTYRYRFLVDDRWVSDPSNPKGEVNPFGETNSLVEIKQNKD